MFSSILTDFLQEHSKLLVLCICCLPAQLAAQTHKAADFACKAELAARQSAHFDLPGTRLKQQRPRRGRSSVSACWMLMQMASCLQRPGS